MSEDFGRGIFLADGVTSEFDWDFEIDETGDLRTTSTGQEELQKDVAYRTAENLQPIIGRPSTPETENDASAAVKNAMIQDPRIRRVSSLNVRIPDDQVNKIDISATVLTDEGTFDLVFEV